MILFNFPEEVPLVGVGGSTLIMSDEISDLHMNCFLITVKYQSCFLLFGGFFVFVFLHFRNYEIQPSRSPFCSTVLYLPNEMKWSLAKTLTKPS